MSLLLLFQNPPQIDSGLDLYICGHGTASNSATLYIAGPIPSDAGMNLYLESQNPLPVAGSLDLSINGIAPGLGGHFASATLHMLGGAFTSAMNLYLESVLSDITVRNMNLFLKGSYPVSNQSLNLYLQNDGIRNIVNLFIRGTGTFVGGTPYTNSLNMFLQKMPSEMIPLYLRGPFESSSESLTFFIGGVTINSNSVDLVIANTKGEAPATLKLYTNGF